MRSDLSVHWFLPTAGDSRDVVGFGPTVSRRDPDLDYLGQVARAAEEAGFDAVLTPTGTWCEDAWLTCAALAQQTERLKFLVAFRPGFISPTLAAQQASTFQRLSAGRLLLNVVTGGEPDEQAAEKIAWIRGLAGQQHRQMRFGIRFHVVARDTSAEAWAAAERLIA